MHQRHIISAVGIGLLLGFAPAAGGADTHSPHGAPAAVSAHADAPKDAHEKAAPPADTQATAHTAPATPAAHAPGQPNLAPAEALARLIDGNDRFRYGESSFPRFDVARRSETFANGQKPFAAVLSCADSRVPVEAVFDQGIGDLFVIRVAGNVADEDEIGTIEYGVGHLGTGLIVVLGHGKCGAVTAVADGAQVHGHIARLVDNIAPAVEAVKDRDPSAVGQRLVRLAIRANVQQSIHDLLSRSETIATAVKEGRLQVVGGVYDLQTGSVDWLGQHPRQAEILAAGVNEAAAPAGELTHEAPKPAATEHPPVHEPAADDDHHGAPTDKKPAKPADGHSKATPKPSVRKENWVALGALLGASAVGSFGTIHMIYGRRPASG